ncbi:MAG: alpha-amylase family glycosyl hydrolase [Chloroflexota bacterium]|nr:alpha-amylase family glycosyl hydrolase [Chloroflexota bacterium]
MPPVLSLRHFRAAPLLVWIMLALLLTIASTSVLAADNNVNWNELGHNSRDPLYRYPQGAVPTGTAVTLRFRAVDGDLTNAQVRVWNDRVNISTVYDMTRVASGVTFPGDANLYEFWEVTLPVSAVSTVYWYRFIATDGSATAYYEDDDRYTGGWGATIGSSPDRGWQLTHYDPAFETPDWIKNAVVYQVFVDRFRDGNSANNPAAGGFFYGANDTLVRSNAADWNTRVCDPRSAPGSSSVCAGGYSQNFYGGDLQGVIDQLDYLDGLGVTALYLNPIFESPSNHKYDTTDFMQIDDNFGDLALFQSLSTQAEALGIRLILDGVFNHTSSDSIYFDRYGRFSESGACESSSSPYIDWFPFKPYTGGGTAPCSDNRDYNYWFGIFDSLPVLDHDDAGVRSYFLDNGTASVAPYWMQWADGWRLDVAPEIDHGTLNDPSDNYMETLRAAVHAVNPETYIVGEEWGNSTSWTIDNQWDATMNYQYGSAFLSFFRDENFVDNDHNGGSSAGVLAPLSPYWFNERILNWRERYAPEAYHAMMNLLGSHDTSRALFMLDHNTDTATTATYNNPAYDWSDSIARLKGVAIAQLTMPGAPTIYYGDEVGTVNPPAWDGSQWQDDPYNRVPYPWLDQTGTPYYTHMQTSGAQTAIKDHYVTLTTARNAHPALRTGELIPVLIDDTAGIYAYLRLMSDDSDAALVILNNGAADAAVTVDLSGYTPVDAAWTELFSVAVYTADASADLTIPVVPFNSGVVLFPVTSFAGGRPAAVTDLAGTPAANQVTLDWSDVSGAAVYNVYRSRLSHGGWQLIASPTDSTYQDTGLTNAVKYWYMIETVAANGLTGDDSNEVGIIPAIDLGGGGVWYNLQYPHTIEHVLSATNETPNIYGQIWIQGVTDTGAATAAPGIRAQVGYGPAADAPSSASWTWFEMAPNVGYDFAGQSNDEYAGTMLPTQVGTFNYTTRYSADGGSNWFYTDKNAPPYDAADAGVLTVTAPTDVIAPAAPTGLTVTGTTAVSVMLAWDAHPNTDGDLFGFVVDRAPVVGGTTGTFTEIASVTGAAAVSYTDATVTTGERYEYVIRAVDTSLNESTASNSVQALAEMRAVDITFRATVPAGTPGVVYIAGNFGSGYPQWNPGAMAMTQVSPGVWEREFSILDGTQVEYKYTRGAWEMVEKQADGNAEVDNRRATVDYGTTGVQTVENTIDNWRDPFVTTIVPGNGTAAPAATTIAATWNQRMNEGSVEDSAGFTVTGPSGAVTGTLDYVDATQTVTFTPSSALAPGAYTISISGRQDAGGDTQQVTQTFTFGVNAYDLSMNSWYNLQYPPAIEIVFGAGATPNIYGQIWIQGVTDASGSAVPNVKAQVGYGPAADVPSSASWTWFEMTPNSGYNFGQSNDEYQGTMTPGAVGVFNFTTRWSADGGVTWYYTDKNAPPYDAADAGVLTVTAPTDTTAPAAPTNLVVTGTTAVSVGLGWDAHPNTDGDLAGFKIYRAVVTGGVAGTPTEVGNVMNPAAVAFSDTTVTAGTTYEYTVKAIDSSANQSAASNAVQATPVALMVAVTFRATVPAHTIGTVHLVGDFGAAGYPGWDPGLMPMTEVSPDVWEIVLNLPDGYSAQYKFARGSWDKVEKEIDGNAETPNRVITAAHGGTGMQTAAGTVSNWRDPYVILSMPEAGGILPYNGTVTVGWNQTLNAASATDLAGFTVTRQGGSAVVGTLAYDGGTGMLTFTPSAPLTEGTYDVVVAGRTDAGGDSQQVTFMLTFSVPAAPAVPTAIAPTGTLAAAPTMFSWNAVESAAWYYLWIGNTNGSHVLDQWYAAADVCVGGICSVTVSAAMIGGVYDWFLQSFNALGGYSAWSAPTRFTVALAPGMTTPIAPTGTIATGMPRFEFTEVPDAAWYYLWVSGPDGYVMDQWYERGAICAAGVCAVTPGLNLFAGAYRWWIQAWSTTGGYGAWAGAFNFSVNRPLPAPTPIAPIVSTSSTPVTYTWNRLPGATWYYLWVSDVRGPKLIDRWYAAADVCVDAICSVTPILAYRIGDNYRYWLQAWSETAGYSPWSAETRFTVTSSGRRSDDTTIIEQPVEMGVQPEVLEILPEEESSAP